MNETEYYHLVIRLGYFLIASRGILLYVSLRKLFDIFKDSAYRMLFWYSLIALIIAIFEVLFIHIVPAYREIFIPILTKLEIDDTFFISPFYYLNEIIFVGLFFSKSLSSYKAKIIKYASTTLFLIEIVNTLFWESYKESQPFGSIIFPIFVVICAITLLKENYNKKVNLMLRTNSLSLISIGFLMMGAFSIMFFFFSDKLFKNYIILYYQISLSRMLVESLGILIIAYGVHLYKPSKNS